MSFLTTSRGALQPPSHHILEAAVTSAITSSCLSLSDHSLLSLQLAQLKSSVATALQVDEEILPNTRDVFSPLCFHSLFTLLGSHVPPLGSFSLFFPPSFSSPWHKGKLFYLQKPLPKSYQNGMLCFITTGCNTRSLITNFEWPGIPDFYWTYLKSLF